MPNPYLAEQIAKGATHAWGHSADFVSWHDLIGGLDFESNGALRNIGGGPTVGLPDSWSLDGVDNYLTAGDHPDFDLTSAPFSVEMWVWMGDTGHSESFSAYFSKGDTVGYQARRSTDNAAIRFDVRPQDGSFDSSTFIETVVQDLNTSWRHIVWAHTGSTMRIIVDGQVVASASGKQPNIGVNDWPLVIGAQSEPNFRRFSRMEVAAFALYPGVALTASDAQDLIAAANEPVTDDPAVTDPVIDAGDDVDDWPAGSEFGPRAITIVDDGGTPAILSLSWELVDAPPGHGLPTAYDDPLIVTPTVPGAYTFRAQIITDDGAGGILFATDTFTLTVVAAPVPVPVTVEPPAAGGAAAATPPDVRAAVRLGVPAAGAAAAAAPPDVSSGVTVTGVAAAATAAATPPDVSAAVSVTLSAAAAHAAAASPEVITGTEIPRTITVPAAAGHAAATPPTVAVAVTVTVPAAGAHAAAAAPNVTGAVAVNIAVPAAGVAAAATAPHVEATGAVTITVPAAAAAATATPPAVAAAVTLTPPAAPAHAAADPPRTGPELPYHRRYPSAPLFTEADAQPQRFHEAAQPARFDDADAQPQRFRDADAQPQRFDDADAQPARFKQAAQPDRFKQTVQPDRFKQPVQPARFFTVTVYRVESEEDDPMELEVVDLGPYTQGDRPQALWLRPFELDPDGEKVEVELYGKDPEWKAYVSIEPPSGPDGTITREATIPDPTKLDEVEPRMAGRLGQHWLYVEFADGDFVEEGGPDGEYTLQVHLDNTDGGGSERWAIATVYRPIVRRGPATKALLAAQEG